MTAAAIGRGPTGGDLLLWGAAGAVGLAAHVALAALLMREPPVAPSDPAAPTAVMLDLAPVPAAPKAQETQVAPDVIDQQEVLEAPEPTPELPDPLVEARPMRDLPPPPELAAPLEDVLPPVAMTPVEPAEVAVTRPRARPEVRLRRPEPERVVRRPPEEEPPREARQAARAEAPPAPKPPRRRTAGARPARCRRPPGSRG